MSDSQSCDCGNFECDNGGNFADRLLNAIEAKGSPVCVGLDPVYDRLPDEFKVEDPNFTDEIEAMSRYCGEVIKIVSPYVPAVKPQVAYFERYGALGLSAYFQAVADAQAAELVVIGDVKRGDIGSTAAAYADAHMTTIVEGEDALNWSPDAITVNGYFGLDGTKPFMDACVEGGCGIFVLVRTSNPGGATVQDFQAADGTKFFEHIAKLVAEMGNGDGLVGEMGYSSVGAVVGATYPDEARQLRKLMPRQIFLVPGYGAQGATAKDCVASFDSDGRGAIVNASRSVLYAYGDDRSSAWRTHVEKAAKDFAADIASALG